MKITFSKKAKRAIDLIENTRKHVFVTGKAGTGKSTLLEYIRNNTVKKMVVLAPTGVAAVNVGGDTLHSFFSLKPGFEKAEAKNKRIDKEKIQKYKRVETILIDEISMVRADMLDAIDIFLRRARKSGDPFGGVQMVFFGDLFQLPPVITHRDKEAFFEEYSAPYFFAAELFKGKQNLFAKEFTLEFIELDKIYRQSDDAFIDILNAVRENTMTSKLFIELNKRYDPVFIPKKEKYIYLMTTNADAHKINAAELAKIDSADITYHATQKGDIDKNIYPNDLEVCVKVGAQIMFIYNDPERRWVNGTIGVITNIEGVFNEETNTFESILTVEKDDGELVEVAPYTWDISKYVYKKGEFERESLGSFRQIPLKLAWAITIHKSQGKTFDRVVIDLGRGSFAHGQTYVALSRCTSLQGVVLKKRIGQSSIIMDERVKKFRG
jgi:ATP-dependent DNA helicase PIF1